MFDDQIRIYLLGFMGCGKSTIGRSLADKLKMKFIDLDHIIEVQEGRSIKECFEYFGEEAFRKIEHEALKQTFEIQSCVISLGGGTPCFHENMTLVNENGVSFYLSLDADSLATRLENEKDHRPLLKKVESKKELVNFIKLKLEKRNKFYLEAQHIIRAQQTVTEIIAEIIDQLNS